MKTTFFHGVMKASKSAQLILKAKNYQVNGVMPIIVKPDTDTRKPLGYVSSRIGIKMPLYEYVATEDSVRMAEIAHIARVTHAPLFIDEAQFFTPATLEVIFGSAQVAKSEEKENEGFNVFFYGLLKDYNNRLFDGSSYLLENVDSIKEIKTTCEFDGCDRKATCNFLNDEGDGGIVHIGDDQYNVYCQYHYNVRLQQRYDMKKGEKY